MDPVAFRVSGRTKLAFSVKAVTFRPFWRRDMFDKYPFIYRRTCCSLAIIFNIPVLFL